MGNALCPPSQPAYDPFTEQRQRRQQRASTSGGGGGGFGDFFAGFVPPAFNVAAAATAASSEDPREPKRATLSIHELHHLPIEEYATREDMMRWPMRRLVAELERARKNSPADHAKRDGPAPLEKAELVDAVLAARGGESGTQCFVCFEDYEKEDGLRVLPCGHRFHVECVDRWLRSKAADCPLCNHDARDPTK